MPKKTLQNRRKQTNLGPILCNVYKSSLKISHRPKFKTNNNKASRRKCKNIFVILGYSKDSGVTTIIKVWYREEKNWSPELHQN